MVHLVGCPGSFAAAPSFRDCRFSPTTVLHPRAGRFRNPRRLLTTRKPLEKVHPSHFTRAVQTGILAMAGEMPLSSTACRIAGPLRALLADVTNRAGSPLGGASLARSSGTTGTSSPRTPRRTVNLREDNYELVSRAAEDPAIRQFIGGVSLESCKQANQEILLTALKNHGVVSDGPNGVRISHGADAQPLHARGERAGGQAGGWAR